MFLFYEQGTDEIKGLSLRLTETSKICLPIEGFKNMNRLSLLQLTHVEFSGNYDDLFEDLKWLCWLGFSSKFLSSNFYKGSLVAIELRYSNLELFWKLPQVWISIINISTSNLRHFPFSSLTLLLKKFLLVLTVVARA